MTGKRAAVPAPWLTLERRGWLYRVLTAAALLLAGYGYLTDSELSLWLGLAGAVLGTGTASAFTPTGGKSNAPD